MGMTSEQCENCTKDWTKCGTCYVMMQWVKEMMGGGRMSYIEKEKLIKADIASIENRVRHAFNQGYDLGFKDGKKRTKPQEPILDKIREQIKDYLRGVEITLEVLVENDPLRPKMEGAKDTLEECLDLIDKAESEDKVSNSKKEKNEK